METRRDRYLQTNTHINSFNKFMTKHALEMGGRVKWNAAKTLVMTTQE